MTRLVITATSAMSQRRLLRRGAGMETVKQCLGHASITTTMDTYGHLTVEDARQALEAAGWFTGREVRW